MWQAALSWQSAEEEALTSHFLPAVLSKLAEKEKQSLAFSSLLDALSHKLDTLGLGSEFRSLLEARIGSFGSR